MCLRLLEAEDFESPAHQDIFKGLRQCALEDAQPDPPGFADRFPALRQAVCDLPFEATDERQTYWCAKLQSFGMQAKAEATVERMATLVVSEGSWSQKAAELKRLFSAIGQHERVATRLGTPEEVLATVQPTEVVYTGFWAWDDLVGGCAPGIIHVLAGRPGRGKTTLTVQWAMGLAGHGYPTVIVPLELEQVQTAKLCQSHVEQTGQCYILGGVPRQWELLMLDIEWAIEAAQAKVLCIDHIGYIRDSRYTRQTRTEEIGNILRDLRSLCRRLRITAIVVSQLNRAVEGRKSERPTLADLRDSGEIEQEADTVTFLWAKKGEMLKAQAECVLTVEKNRYGPTGEIAVMFDRPARRFHTSDEGVPF